MTQLKFASIRQILEKVEEVSDLLSDVTQRDSYQMKMFPVDVVQLMICCTDLHHIEPNCYSIKTIPLYNL